MHLISPQDSGHSIMTHVILNSDYEITEQLANGDWVVLIVNTGKIREISDYSLRNIHQDDYDQKGREMTAWIESGCKM
jgi:hypothetical protein